MPLGQALLAIIRQDLILAFRNKSEFLQAVVFFMMMMVLFPLALAGQSQLLKIIAPGIIWVCVLLASLLASDHLFRSDYEDGCLEQWMLSPHPTTLLVLAKILAHWLATVIPLIIVAPLFGLLLGMPSIAFPTLISTLMIATPTLTLIQAIGVALTLGLRRGGILLAILVLPLSIPVLIFASEALQNAANGLPVSAQIDILLALLLLSLVLAPLPIAAALKMSLQ